MSAQNQSSTQPAEVTQEIQLAPVDFTGIQVPTPQNHLINRKYKGVIYDVGFTLDGNSSVFLSGEVATILKKEFAMKGGVNLVSLQIIVRGTTEGKKIAFAFHSPSEEYTSLDDLDFARNSVSLIIGGSTNKNRFQVNYVFPTALGMQVVPPDPYYNALHMSYGVEEGFTGTLQFFFTYDCDMIYNKSRGSF